MDGHLAAILLVCLPMLSVVLGDFQLQSDDAGVHCGNITLRPEKQLLNDTDHYHCVHCLFPQNCEANNTCRAGTAGRTCEHCQQHTQMQYRYHRVGSMCTLCPTVPWAVIAFGVYLLLFLCMGFFIGLKETVCTKMKMLCHFLQYLQLSLHIKVAWPDRLAEFVSYVAFASFNTNILNPECLFPAWPLMSEHYFEWVTSIGFPVVVMILGYFLDKSMRKLGKAPKSDKFGPKLPRRTSLRRLVFFVVMVMYMPAAVSCFRSYQCSNTVPMELVLDHTEDIFLLNNDARCDTFTFQTIHFVATLYLVFMIILCPVMIVFFTLRQKKWDLLYEQWKLYSALYEPYKDRYCFWESIPLLRKLVAVLITEAYPFSAKLQVFVQLGMSAAYILLILLLRPYRPTYWGHPLLNVNIIFEVISNVVICVVQGVALSIVLGVYQSLYGIAVIALVGTTLVIWLLTVLAMSCETRPEINLNQVVPFVEEAEGEIKEKSTKLWSRKSRKVEQVTKFEERVNENKEKLNF